MLWTERNIIGALSVTIVAVQGAERVLRSVLAGAGILGSALRARACCSLCPVRPAFSGTAFSLAFHLGWASLATGKEEKQVGSQNIFGRKGSPRGAGC